MKSFKLSMVILAFALLPSSLLGKAVFKVPKTHSEKSDPWFKKSRTWNPFDFDSQFMNSDRNKIIIFLFNYFI